MITKHIAACFLASSLLATAGISITEAQITVDGNTYHNVAIDKLSPALARINHSSGIKRIDISQLPKSVQDRLEYDPAAAKAYKDKLAKRAETQRAEAAAAREQAAILAKSAVKKLWVSENREDGLVVGHFSERRESIGSSSSRVGGGGFSTSFTVYTKNYRYAFIPHTGDTKALTTDKEFRARIVPDGTFRYSQADVIPKYRLLSIEPDKKSK